MNVTTPSLYKQLHKQLSAERCACKAASSLITEHSSADVIVLSIYTESRKKLDPFSSKHNFRKYCPILTILSLLQTEITCPQNENEFATSSIVCCCIKLKNATTYTSSKKVLNKSAMPAVILFIIITIT